MSRSFTLVLSLLLSAVLVTEGRAVDFDRAKLIEQLTKHEGKREKAYKDSEGILTIGVGFNLERPGAKDAIEALGLNFDKVKSGTQELTETQILKLLDKDVDTAVANCKAVFPKFTDLSDVRQRVLIDMMFNLGRPRFEKFKKMIAAVNKNDFTTAADEMKDSKWYEQVKVRGKTLESMMRSDKDPS